MKLLLTTLLLLSSVTANSQNSAMTFNIKYDNQSDTVNNWNDRKESLVNLIKDYSPSFIGLQEGLHRQVKYIDSSLTNYKYIGVGRDDGNTKGEYSAIFYDTTIIKPLKSSTFWLSDTPDTISVGWDASMERICTYGLFENINTNSTILVFNTHFDHIGMQARENSAELLLNIIAAYTSNDEPVILMGDFNLLPTSTPILNIKKELRDSYDFCEIQGAYTDGTFNGFANEFEPKRIDYIFIRNLNVHSYDIIYSRLDNIKFISDHFPVNLRFSIAN